MSSPPSSRSVGHRAAGRDDGDPVAGRSRGGRISGVGASLRRSSSAGTSRRVEAEGLGVEGEFGLQGADRWSPPGGSRGPRPRRRGRRAARRGPPTAARNRSHCAGGQITSSRPWSSRNGAVIRSAWCSGRALAVAVGHLGERPDQRLQVLRLEVVGLAGGPAGQVEDRVADRAAGVDVGGGERGGRGPAARAAAADGEPGRGRRCPRRRARGRRPRSPRRRPRPTARAAGCGTRGRSRWSRRS